MRFYAHLTYDPDGRKPHYRRYVLSAPTLPGLLNKVAAAAFLGPKWAANWAARFPNEALDGIPRGPGPQAGKGPSCAPSWNAAPRRSPPSPTVSSPSWPEIRSS